MINCIAKMASVHCLLNMILPFGPDRYVGTQSVCFHSHDRLRCTFVDHAAVSALSQQLAWLIFKPTGDVISVRSLAGLCVSSYCGRDPPNWFLCPFGCLIRKWAHVFQHHLGGWSGFDCRQWHYCIHIGSEAVEKRCYSIDTLSRTASFWNIFPSYSTLCNRFSKTTPLSFIRLNAISSLCSASI
jgi:hypothetical protein